MPTLTTKAARALNARRKTHAGGAPKRTDVPRCICGAETLARCRARGKSNRHQPTCEWWKRA